MGDDFDDEGVALTGTGDMVSKLERKDRKTVDHVFGLGTDEEDKLA
jgi:hypothetical protein